MSLSILQPPRPAFLSRSFPAGSRFLPATLRARRMAELVPVLRSRAAPAGKAGRAPAQTLAVLREAGSCRIVQPAIFGGYGHDFPVLADLVTGAAKGCPSTGWVYGLYAAHQWLVASLAEQARHDVWDADPDAALCSSCAPAGKAEAVEGGDTLNERWLFASRCDGAQRAVCASFLPPRADEQPVGPAFFLVPATDFLIDGEWATAGLGATGSKVLDDVFVPQHRVPTFREATSGHTPGRALHDPGFGIPMPCRIPSRLASTAVGAAAGALDCLRSPPPRPRAARRRCGGRRRDHGRGPHQQPSRPGLRGVPGDPCGRRERGLPAHQLQPGLDRHHGGAERPRARAQEATLIATLG